MNYEVVIRERTGLGGEGSIQPQVQQYAGVLVRVSDGAAIHTDVWHPTRQGAVQAAVKYAERQGITLVVCDSTR